MINRVAAFRLYRRLEVAFCRVAALVFVPSIFIAITTNSRLAIVGAILGFMGITLGVSFGACRKRCQEDLMGMGPEAIGPLAESLYFDLYSVTSGEQNAWRLYWRGITIGGLHQLILNAPQDHHYTLNNDEARCLYRCLDPIWTDDEGTFQSLIVDRLLAFPDHRATFWIERLAQEYNVTPLGRELQGKTVRCLPLLQAQAEQLRTAYSLLRPSESTDSETLLRPQSSDPGGESELLRSVVAPGAANSES